MKRADIILISIILCVFIVFISIYIFKDTKDNTIVVITHDKKTIYNASIDIDKVIEIKDDNGNILNSVTIKDGQVHMSYATCPNKDCILTGFLDKGTKKQIACLPNKVLIYLVSENYEMDGISK